MTVRLLSFTVVWNVPRVQISKFRYFSSELGSVRGWRRIGGAPRVRRPCWPTLLHVVRCPTPDPAVLSTASIIDEPGRSPVRPGGDTITPIGTIFLSGFDLNCFPSPRRHTRIVHRHFPKRGIEPRVRDVRLDPAVRRNAARRGRMELRDMCAPIKIIFAAIHATPLTSSP